MADLSFANDFYNAPQAIACGLNRFFRDDYLDNVTYAPGSTRYPSWDETCTYLNKLREELYGEGIRLLINVAWYVGRQYNSKQELKDVDSLANAVEGIALESGQILYPGDSLESASGKYKKNKKQLFREDKKSVEHNLKVFPEDVGKRLDCHLHARRASH